MSNSIVFSTDPKIMQQNTPDKLQSEIEKTPQETTLTIQREVKGRGGKTVSVIRGLSCNKLKGEQLLKELKQHCGCGGTYKEGVLELQGDKKLILHAFLSKKGFKIKLVGG